LLLGFHKKSSGKKSITYAGSAGRGSLFWVDRRRAQESQRNKLHDSFYAAKAEEHLESYQRETRRAADERGTYACCRARSVCAPRSERTGIYSFENRPRELSPAYEKTFRQNPKAWKFFQEQPPPYKRLMIFRTMSAKKEETQIRRLKQLIESSEKGVRL
jgi:hypothetical protein